MSTAPDNELDPTASDIYDLLRRQPGDRFSVSEIAAQLGYDAPDIEARLSRLAQRGLVERAESDGHVSYILSTGAPEL